MHPLAGVIDRAKCRIRVFGPATKTFCALIAESVSGARKRSLPVEVVLAVEPRIQKHIDRAGGSTKGYLTSTIGSLSGCHVKLVDSQIESPAFFLADEQSAIAFPTSDVLLAISSAASVIEAPYLLDVLNGQFDLLWQSSDSALTILHQDVIVAADASQELGIVTAGRQFWDLLISHLAAHPEQFHGLTPRRFEELIAELLIRDGFDVHVTPFSRDGGRDIMARLNTAYGEHLYLVECKRYAADRPVGVASVRGLYGVVAAEKATMGVLVTTSRYTKDARAFRETVKHQISLQEHSDLVRWLHGFVRKPPVNM